MLILATAASASVRALADEKPPQGGQIGMMLLMVYDIGGMTSRVPVTKLDHFSDISVDVPALLTDMRATFQPTRIDGFDPHELWDRRPSAAVVFAQWRSLLSEHPMAYLAHRWEVLAWMLGLREPQACLPIHLGVAAQPAQLLAELGLKEQPPERYAALYQYAARHFDGPIFRPVFWLALVGVCAAVMVVRGGRKHRFALALAAGTLTYCLAYAVIGIACDVRYMYVATPVALWMCLTLLVDLAEGGRSRPGAHELE